MSLFIFLFFTLLLIHRQGRYTTFIRLMFVCMYIKIELSWDVLQKVSYLGHSGTKDRDTFHISQLQMQIKVGYQLKDHFIPRSESSEKVTLG